MCRAAECMNFKYKIFWTCANYGEGKGFFIICHLCSIRGCFSMQKDLSGFWKPHACFSFREVFQGAEQVSSFWVGQILKLNWQHKNPGKIFLSLFWNFCWKFWGFWSLGFWGVFEEPGAFTARSRVHFWPTPEALIKGMLLSQASALNNRTSSMNSVTKLTLSLVELKSLAPKWIEFKKYSRVATDMFQGWIMWIGVLREAKAWRISSTEPNSFLQDSASLSFEVLAALSTSGESLVMEISFAPGLCKIAQMWLLMLPLSPTPSES